MLSVPCLRQALDTVLNTAATQIARDTGCVQRERKFSGATLVQTLVLGWWANPQASLHDLTQMAATRGVLLSPQAIDQRFTPALAACLEQVLAAALEQPLPADPAPIPLLQRFPAVALFDSTTISLPAAWHERWAGCGNHHEEGQAALKLQVGFDLLSGQLRGPVLQPGRASDRTSPLIHQVLPAESLQVADLGYFSLDRLQTLSIQRVGWLSRLQAGTGVFLPNGARCELADGLAQQSEPVIDQPVTLGVRQRLPARLLAIRVPATVAAERRTRLQAHAQAKGRPVSLLRLALVEWTVLITNLPPERLSVAEADVLYGARWQIELLFKLWKQHGQLAHSRSTNPLRVLCEIYAKLIGLVLQHWLLLWSCWADPHRSLVKAAKTIRTTVIHLAWVLDQPDHLDDLIIRLRSWLAKTCRLNPRRTKPNTAQRLLAPTLSA